MTVVHGLLVGIGVLILVYLGVKNSSSVVNIFNATGTQGTKIIKQLQTGGS